MAEAGLPAHLAGLNPEQLDAVTTVQGPLLILAGAGSGKTRVLTRRVAHLLHTGVAPPEVLAVTFTNKAASEMRERIDELVGDGSRVWVSTFHSTCARILRQEIEALGFTRRFAIYDDDDQLRLIKGLVLAAGYDPHQVEPRVLMSRIDHYKNRMSSPDELLKEMRSSVGDPLVRIWRDYEDALRAADALDFNDLVSRTVELFGARPDVLAKWRQRFRYVMVDEYQDTNRAQYLLLRQLADEHRNLAVVGDDDQSIYGFRGADVSNLLGFQQDFPEAKVVRLEQNYRSTANILALANAVVAHNAGRLDKRLWTQGPRGPKVQLAVASGPREEAARVAEMVQKVVALGSHYGDVAIVYRTNAVARFFEASLRALRIPHRVVGGRKFYERREVRDVLAYLRLIVNPADDAAFLRVVNVPPRGVGAKTQTELRQDAASRGQPLLATARARGMGRTAQEKGLAAFVLLVDGLADVARDRPLDELVAEVVERSGYRAMLEGDKDRDGRPTPDAAARLANLNDLLSDARSAEVPGFGGQNEWAGARMGAPLDRLTHWLDRISLSADTDEIPDGGEVTLLTVHSAKGLEFPIVFVVQMNEGMFPHERNAELGLEEERRLAYVAFTRAMQRLVVTRTLTDIQGRPMQPSRFLFDLPADVIDGDLPPGTAATGDRDQRREATATSKSKFGAFLAYRQARAAGMPPRAAPQERHTLVDIEDITQLEPGVRILEPRYGLGEIRTVRGRQLLVTFGTTQRWIPANSRLRIVSE
jgi:DNA helicase-2/ATP-dependent DNA helicase PcrA